MEDTDILDLYRKMPHGNERLEANKEAIKLADEKGEPLLQFITRNDLMAESVFHNNGVDIFWAFSEMVELCKANLQEYENDFMYDILWNFKWVITTAGSFYQIDAETVEKYLEEFREYLIKYNYSLYTYYYLKLSIALSREMQLEEINELYAKTKEYDRDTMSDCEYCEMCSEIQVHLLNENMVEALKLLDKEKKGRGSCAEQPAYSFYHFGEYYFRKNSYMLANSYFELFLKEMENGELSLDEFGMVVASMSFVNTKKALEIYSKYIVKSTGDNNPTADFYMYLGSAYLWKNLMKEGNQMIFFDNENQKYCLEQNNNFFVLKELYDYNIEEAKSLAKKLDSSNNCTVMADEIKRLEER